MYKNWLIHSMLFSFLPFVTCCSQSYHNWQWKYSLWENQILFNWNARLSSHAKIKSLLIPYYSLIYHICYQGKVVSTTINIDTWLNLYQNSNLFDYILNILMYDRCSLYQSSLSWMITLERQTNILAKYWIYNVRATHVLFIVIHWFICEWIVTEHVFSF